MKFLVYFLIIFQFAWSAEKTICLNMIVKDESHVIERCLHSVKEIIDYWIIVDTGSSDNTKELIQETLKDIPGELHERPWVHFGHNRQEALELAKHKTDYILFIDADEEFVYSEPFDKNLTKDGYQFIIRNDRTQYHRLLLVRSSVDWYWMGSVHENLHCDTSQDIGLCETVICNSYVSGSRSQDPEKYQKDIALLEKQWKQDPKNPRPVFYIAQSYANIPDYENALKYYKIRSQMGGWDQEIYYSLQSVGKLQDILEYPSEQVLKSLADAYCFNPKRAEPLYYIANHLMKHKNYLLAYMVAEKAIQIPLCKEAVYVEQWVYYWGSLLQYAECSFRLRKFAECLNAIDRLLTEESLPGDVRSSLENNQRIVLEYLALQ